MRQCLDWNLKVFGVKSDGNDGQVKVQESKIAKILVAFEWEWDGETLWYTGKASIPPAKSRREPPKNLQQFSNDCTDGLSVDFQWHESDNFQDCMNDMECQMPIHHPHGLYIRVISCVSEVFYFFD